MAATVDLGPRRAHSWKTRIRFKASSCRVGDRAPPCLTDVNRGIGNPPNLRVTTWHSSAARPPLRTPDRLLTSGLRSSFGAWCPSERHMRQLFCSDGCCQPECKRQESVRLYRRFRQRFGDGFMSAAGNGARQRTPGRQLRGDCGRTGNRTTWVVRVRSGCTSRASTSFHAVATHSG
jgi:hypothetical protein